MTGVEKAELIAVFQQAEQAIRHLQETRRPRIKVSEMREEIYKAHHTIWKIAQTLRILIRETT